MSLKTVLYRPVAGCFVLALLSLTALGQAEQRMRMPADEITVSFPAGKSSVEVPFETERNWIIIPVSINGSRPLRFVLDTGAGGAGASLINYAVADSLKLNIVGRVQVRGAGSGPATEVPIAGGVSFDIGGAQLGGGRMSVRSATSTAQPMSAGRDGVIGRPVFANLIVEIDWERKVVKLHDPKKFSYAGKGAVLPLTFDEMGRPYTTASVTTEDAESVPVKLVVDSGGGHNLSLELGSGTTLKAPSGATKVVLGRGASGEFTGYTGQVKGFQLGGFALQDIPTIYPDESYGPAWRQGRDGNLGGGILRRFKVIYDYSRKQMIVEPNKFFDEPFAVAPTSVALAASTKVSPYALQEYIGRYGERTISFEDGGLHLQRTGGPKVALVATAKDEFGIQRIPAARIRFGRDETGKVTEIQVLNPEGIWEKSKKETSNQPAEQMQPVGELSLVEREVRMREREWLDAYERHDAEAMDRILGGDFKITHPDGRVQSKADVIAQLKKAKESGQAGPKFSTEEVQSRVDGNAVILTGRFVMRSTREGRTREMQARYTDRYEKREGRWQVVSSVMTSLPRQ